MDTSEQTVEMGMKLAFDSIPQLAEISEVLKSVKEIEKDLPSEAQGISDLNTFQNFNMEWQKGRITILQEDLFNEEDMAELTGEEEEADDEDVDVEGFIEMMEMMVGEMSMTLTVHAPGEIYRCECGNGTVDGKIMTYVYDFRELLMDSISYKDNIVIYYE